MADYGMMILDYLLGFDYLVVFVAGVFLGIWVTKNGIRKGIQFTQDIQTNYPIDNFVDKSTNNQDNTE